jgi:hypothetical protein
MIDIEAQEQYNSTPLKERLKDPKFDLMREGIKTGFKDLIRYRSSRGNRGAFRSGFDRINWRGLHVGAGV